MDVKYQTPPKQEKSEILELTIDLNHPSKEITETAHKPSNNLDFLLKSRASIAKKL